MGLDAVDLGGGDEAHDRRGALVGGFGTGESSQPKGNFAPRLLTEPYVTVSRRAEAKQVGDLKGIRWGALKDGADWTRTRVTALTPTSSPSVISSCANLKHLPKNL